MRRQRAPKLTIADTGWLRRFEVREIQGGLAIATNTTGNVVEVSWDELCTAEKLCGVLIQLSALRWIPSPLMSEFAFKASSRFGYRCVYPKIEECHGS